MKLVEIRKEILNEAAPKNPLGLFRNIFKAAGVNFAEVESALLFSLKQLDPKITSLTKATPEQIERAFKTTSFRKYSQTIARNYIANNDKVIEGILKKHQINTTQGSKTARLEIANTLGVNKSIADDIFVIKKPKKVTPTIQTPKPQSTTSTPTSTVLPILNNRNSLMSYIDTELKKFGLPKPNQKWVDDFVNDLNGFVTEAYRKQGNKNIDITLDNLEGVLKKMTTDQRQSFYNKALENIKLISKKNKIFYGLYEGMKGKSLLSKEGISNFVEDYKRYAKYIIIANVISLFLDILRKYVDTNKGQPYVYHLGDPKTETYIYVKIVASIIPYLNVVLTTALAGESVIRTGVSIFGRDNIKKEKGKSGVFDDEDLKNNNDNKGVLDGIKDN
jgi:hypothetical protein